MTDNYAYLPQINLDKLGFVVFRCAPTFDAVQPRLVSWVTRQVAWYWDAVVRNDAAVCHAQGKQTIWKFKDNQKLPQLRKEK